MVQTEKKKKKKSVEKVEKFWLEGLNFNYLYLCKKIYINPIMIHRVYKS